MMDLWPRLNIGRGAEAAPLQEVVSPITTKITQNVSRAVLPVQERLCAVYHQEKPGLRSTYYYKPLRLSHLQAICPHFTHISACRP